MQTVNINLAFCLTTYTSKPALFSELTIVISWCIFLVTLYLSYTEVILSEMFSVDDTVILLVGI